MKYWCLRAAAVGVILVGRTGAWAADYDAPADYYSGVTYDASVSDPAQYLKGQLATIMANGQNQTTYAQARDYLPFTDANPDDLTQMLLVYSRTVVQKPSASTVGFTGAYNSREHVYPDSRQGGGTVNSTKGSRGDIIMLRPAAQTENGARANYNYGGANQTGSAALVSGTTYFFAGDYDKGDVARIGFYAATRYQFGDGVGGKALSVVNGNPATTTYALGDLDAMLHWNYQDMPDLFERRRNDVIYRGDDTRTSGDDIAGWDGTNNRNAFVDHPEYVWAVFGGGKNDSQITIKGQSATSGASTRTVAFTPVIVGGSAGTLSTAVTFRKTGVDPTTFSVTAAGSATSSVNGSYNAFQYDDGREQTITVGLTGATTTTAGVRSGSVTVDNTDLTNNGDGTGALDGDDKVNLSLTVLDHSNASFAASTDTDTLVVNFQNVDLNKTASAKFDINNLLSASGYTAGLDLDSIVGVGDTNAFTTNMAAFAALAAGTANTYTVSFTPTATGVFYATYTLGVSDEDLSGATAGNALTLILTGTASYATVPEPATLSLVAVIAVVLGRRRVSA